MEIAAIAIIIALIMSIVLHEMAHGYAANWLGDPTARLSGRLSGNPLVHLDLLGSIIVPFVLFISPTPFLFGWAKPVPYNPYNLNNQRWGEALVAAAGPAINIVLALIFAGLIRSAEVLGLNSAFVDLAQFIVFINLVLAFFNMIPIPPLDGSKILASVLPFKASMKYREFTMWVQSNGLFAAFAFIFLFMYLVGRPFFNFLDQLTELLTGLPF